MLYEKIESALCDCIDKIYTPISNWKFPNENVEKASDYLPNLCDVAMWSVVFLGCLILVIVLIVCVKGIVFKKLSKNLLQISFGVWFIGVILYIAGFYSPNLTFFSVIPRAIISSFKMFAGSNELARVNENLREIEIYMFMFAATHFTAAFITFMFIFRLIGFKVRSRFNIIKHKYIASLYKNRTTHLFWGVNEESLLLAEDIRKKYKKDIIIFIDIDKDDGDNSQKKVSLSDITNTINITNKERERLEKIDALVDHCYNGPAYVDTLNGNHIFKTLHLKSIGKIIQRSSSRKFYFFSDNEELNIIGALNLRTDSKLEKSRIFVHAQRDKFEEIYGNYSKIKGKKTDIKIKVIDSSYLSVRTLINDKNNLPINLIDINLKTAKATSTFTSLIIGFGPTGQEIFKFLYENSACIGIDNKKNDFKCYAIDKRMNEMRGLIETSMPEIKINEELELIQDSVNSQDFWANIEKWISELNYIAIALNDDKLSLSLAVALFKYAIKDRTNNTKLNIVVRLYNDSNDDTIKENIEILNKSVNNKLIKISVLGTKKDIFTYDNIDDKFIDQAKVFNYEYEKIRIKYENENKNKNTKEENKNENIEGNVQIDIEKEIKKCWKKNFGTKATNRLRKKKKISKYHAINDINRRISQNFSNVLHIKTKEILLNLTNDSNRKEKLKLYSDYISYKLGFSKNHPNIKQEDIDKLETIAMVEHERWNASHKIMGYRLGESKDLVKMTHSDIKPWEKLSESTKLYDYIVVKTTIDMLIKEL